MPDGGWGDRVFPKTGRFGVHLKAGSGPTRVSHYKKAVQRKSVATAKQAKMSQIAHPMGQELCFVETQT